jgi:DNA repair protein RadC|tara:strand:- start:107 stop:559 length:453 start_codon:yes stop_codon:yes gene_type:complete
MNSSNYTATVNKISLLRERTSVIKSKISSSIDIARFTRQLYNGSISIYESFYIVLLNNANETIGFVEISKGGITGTLVDVRILVKHALEGLATSVILAHNHPSGQTRPSQADKEITAKVKNALTLFDIKVLDHIILTETDYLSFADEGIL